MSTPSMPMPTSRPAGTRPSVAAWLETKAPWAGLAITSMWAAVLAVGLWGGDIISTSASSTYASSGTRVPAAIVVALFALIGTIFVARWGFGGARDVDELRAAIDDERRARERLEAEVAALPR